MVSTQGNFPCLRSPFFIIDKFYIIDKSRREWDTTSFIYQQIYKL